MCWSVLDSRELRRGNQKWHLACLRVSYTATAAPCVTLQIVCYAVTPFLSREAAGMYVGPSAFDSWKTKGPVWVAFHQHMSPDDAPGGVRGIGAADGRRAGGRIRGRQVQGGSCKVVHTRMWAASTARRTIVDDDYRFTQLRRMTPSRHIATRRTKAGTMKADSAADARIPSTTPGLGTRDAAGPQGQHYRAYGSIPGSHRINTSSNNATRRTPTHMPAPGCLTPPVVQLRTALAQKRQASARAPLNGAHLSAPSAHPIPTYMGLVRAHATAAANDTWHLPTAPLD